MHRTMTGLMMALSLVVVTAAANPAHAQDYQIKITNLTNAQAFTPILAAIHSPGVAMFVAGTAASAELQTLAESGDTVPLAGVLSGLTGVADMTTSAGLTTRGVTIAANHHANKASMLAQKGGGPSVAKASLIGSQAFGARSARVYTLPPSRRGRERHGQVAALRGARTAWANDCNLFTGFNRQVNAGKGRGLCLLRAVPAFDGTADNQLVHGRRMGRRVCVHADGV